MKDIQGVFWGCPRIEALFWPGLGGYVTALTGRALEWHSRGQRFDPAYLHQTKKRTSAIVGGGAFYLSGRIYLRVPYFAARFLRLLNRAFK